MGEKKSTSNPFLPGFENGTYTKLEKNNIPSESHVDSDSEKIHRIREMILRRGNNINLNLESPANFWWKVKRTCGLTTDEDGPAILLIQDNYFSEVGGKIIFVDNTKKDDVESYILPDNFDITQFLDTTNEEITPNNTDKKTDCLKPFSEESVKTDKYVTADDFKKICRKYFNKDE